MVYKKAITILASVIALMATIATLLGIFLTAGNGPFKYQTIRGETIDIYGTGLYEHMSSDVAIQGIAQDYVTLLVGVPLLLIALFYFRTGSLRGHFALAGVLLYFLLTYIFYTAMAMYNMAFLVYVVLLGSSLFAFILAISSFDAKKVADVSQSAKPNIIAGWFLVVNSVMIALLWLNVILTPVFNGSIFPVGLHHYTTLIVQGFDLGIFLPLGFVSGLMAIKRKPWGKVFATIYTIFLSVLMLALTAKVIFMANAGANVIPVIFIMPTICIISITLSIMLLRNLRSNA